jgi:speckle-type POZ protein
LKAHKNILAARSPVLYAMLSGDMQEAQEDFVRVPDFDSKVMKEVLRFIYCTQVENLDHISRDLIYAAEKFHIEELKEICMSNIIETLSTENVVDSLMISERLSNTKKIFVKCLDVIDR